MDYVISITSDQLPLDEWSVLNSIASDWLELNDTSNTIVGFTTPGLSSKWTELYNIYIFNIEIFIMLLCCVEWCGEYACKCVSQCKNANASLIGFKNVKL